MIHLANILIVSDDPALGQELLQKVRRHGYEGRTVGSQEAALATARQEHPDTILLAEGPATDPVAFAKALKEIPVCADIPICLVAASRSPELKALAVAAGIDDVLSPPLDDNKLVARLRPLVRLAIMCAELHQRGATARHFGVDIGPFPPRVTVEADYPLLVVGAPAANEIKVLSGAKVTIAANPYEADDLLGRGNFDASLVLPVGEVAPYLDLCAHIRNNPRLFNLPVLVLAEAGNVSESVAYHHGANGYFNRPVNPVELKSSVLTLVRRQRFRWTIREALGRTLQGLSRDAATGVYNRAFLDRYLEARVGFAASHGRHLSIMFFRVPDVEGIRLRFGEEQAEHLRLQVAQWITGLLRGEDLTARYEENEFCVVLPDTPKAEAEIVMNRIAGVLAYTDFAVKEVYEPVKVWVRVGAADLQPDDDVGSLVGRARSDML